MAADLNQLGMQVTPDNVLGVRNALKGEATRLGDLLFAHASDLQIGRPGNDPVSHHAQPLFQRKVDALVRDCREYVNALNRAGDVLGEVARSYGRTETEIQDSFNQYRKMMRPEWKRQLRQREDQVQLYPLARGLVEPPDEAATPSLPGMFGYRA